MADEDIEEISYSSPSTKKFTEENERLKRVNENERTLKEAGQVEYKSSSELKEERKPIFDKLKEKYSEYRQTSEEKHINSTKAKIAELERKRDVNQLEQRKASLESENKAHGQEKWEARKEKLRGIMNFGQRQPQPRYQRAPRGRTPRRMQPQRDVPLIFQGNGQGSSMLMSGGNSNSARLLFGNERRQAQNSI